MASVYEIVTERIIAKMQEGNIPWHKPWNVETGAPKNLVTNKLYQGINVFLLGCQSYESPFWLTFNQARNLGGSIKKGSKASPVVFWKWLQNKERDPDTGEIEDKKIPLLRYYSVFNLEQTEGVKHNRTAPKAEERTFSPIARAEQIAHSYPNPPRVQIAGSAAFYRPSEDSVTMPKPEAFDTPEHYYSTLYHELGHSTGHSSRLARSRVTNPTRFGSHEYSQEELVAEMTASFLCATAGIEGTFDNSVAYLQSWLRVLKKDSRMIVFAAAQAQKATDLILGNASQTAEDCSGQEIAA